MIHKTNKRLTAAVILAITATAVLHAQSLTQFEYWFDNGIGGQSRPLSGYTSTVNTGIDTNGLKQGMHTFFCRAMQSDGMYSPIYSSTFVKLKIDGGGSALEYWFDDDVDGRQSVSISDYVEDLSVSIATDGIDYGVHTFNYRVSQSGGYSPVSSSVFLKVNAAEGSSLDYWIDDRYETRKSVSASSVEGLIPLQLDMADNADYPVGIHKLSIQVTTGGGQRSPVYSEYFMKTVEGLTRSVTYWIDDDYQHRTLVVSAVQSLSKIINLSNADAGVHRLHIRVASPIGEGYGAVYEVPIMVKSRYDRDGVSYIAARQQWFDDERPEAEESVFLSTSLYYDNITLYPEQFQPGQHAMYVRYKNSSNVWTETNVTYFYKPSSTSEVLQLGLMTDIDSETVEAPAFVCMASDGMVSVDCEARQNTGTYSIAIHDVMGRLIAQRSINESNGLHAEIPVNVASGKTLIVTVGDDRHKTTCKLIMR